MPQRAPSPATTFLVLLAIGLFAGGVRCNPGLLSAIGKNASKFKQVMGWMELDSSFTSSNDIGIKHVNFTTLIDNPVFPHSPAKLSVRVNVYLKYMLAADGRVVIKGFITADTREVAKTPASLHLNPTFHLKSPKAPKFQQSHSWPARAVVHSYWDPPAQAAMVYGFQTQFQLGSGWEEATHDWEISSNLNENTWLWTPTSDLNLFDGSGIHVQHLLTSSKDSTDGEREVYVVLKPVYNFSTHVFGPLIFRHVEYYQNLGVSKHILYLRKESIPSLLLGNPNIAKLVQQGRIILVLWESLPEHDLWSRRYDQRVVYSHAILALTGMNVYLMNIDLDEYLVTSLPELQNQPIQKIIQRCAGDVAEVRIPRYHSLCKDCNHGRPEGYLWGSVAKDAFPIMSELESLNTHPLTWYKLINHVKVPACKSIVNPNKLRSFYIHYGSVLEGFNSTAIEEPKCMFFLHLAHMLKATISLPRVESEFMEDDSWMGMLKHFTRLHLPPSPPMPPAPPPRPPPNPRPSRALLS